MLLLPPFQFMAQFQNLSNQGRRWVVELISYFAQVMYACFSQEVMFIEALLRMNACMTTKFPWTSTCIGEFSLDNACIGWFNAPRNPTCDGTTTSSRIETYKTEKRMFFRWALWTLVGTYSVKSDFPKTKSLNLYLLVSLPASLPRTDYAKLPCMPRGKWPALAFF